MARDWSPNSPETVGFAHLAELSGATAVDAVSKATVLRLPSTAPETIAVAKLYVPTVTQAGRYLFEVYEEGEADDSQTKTTTTFRPNEDVSGVGLSAWSGDPGDDVTNIYEYIDEASFSGDNINSTSGPDTYAGRMGVGVGNLAGRRILAVTLVGVCDVVGGGTAPTFRLNLGGTSYTAHQVVDVSPGSGGGTIDRYATWFWNPSTGRAWTIAEVEALDTTDEYEFVNSVAAPKFAIVYQAYLNVLHVAENRVAHGGEQISAAGWNDFDLFAPTGAANWSKANGVTYDYLLRRVVGDSAALGQATHRYLDSGEDAPGGASSFLPTLDSDGIVTAYGDELTRVYAVHPRTSAPGDSVDSQPYAAIVNAEVYTGHNAEQEFSEANSPAVGDYRRVTFLVKPQAGTTDDLLVKVRLRAGGAQQGGTGTLTVADANALPDAGNGWKHATVTLAADATLAAATQYYVEFSSTQAAVGDAWLVNTQDTVAVGEASGFGGTTDAATIALSGGAAAEDTQYDVPLLLQSVPNEPANVGVTITDRDLPGDGSGCLVASVEQAHLTWDATILGADFVQYEIERTEDGGATWARIAEPDTEATEEWFDLEGRRGVEASYRIRVVRVDESVSDWVEVGPVTPEVSCCELVFTSNEAPDLSVAYTHPPGIRHTFPNGPAVRLVPIYGRDGYLAFRPLEDRLTGFDTNLRVFAGERDDVPPGGQGRAAFDDLRALTENTDLVYVCVLDPDGNRWFADVTVPDGEENQGGAQVYVAPVTGTELTRTPSVPTSQ